MQFTTNYSLRSNWCNGPYMFCWEQEWFPYASLNLTVEHHEHGISSLIKLFLLRVQSCCFAKAF